MKRYKYFIKRQQFTVIGGHGIKYEWRWVWLVEDLDALPHQQATGQCATWQQACGAAQRNYTALLCRDYEEQIKADLRARESNGKYYGVPYEKSSTNDKVKPPVEESVTQLMIGIWAFAVLAVACIAAWAWVMFG